MVFTFRPHQEAAVNDVVSDIAFGENNLIVQAPTAWGKSAGISGVAKELYPQNIVILVNITELIDQISEHLTLLGVEHSILKAGREDEFYHKAKVQLVMSQTLYSRLDKLDMKCDVLVIDEAHKEYDTKRITAIVDKLQPDARVGFTATPWDAKGYALDNATIINTISVLELEKLGYLSPVQYYIPKWSEKVDYSKVKTTGADYNISQLDEVINTSRHIKQSIDTMNEIDAIDKKTIIFCSSIEQCEHVTQELVKQGYRAKAVHSKNSSAYNDTVIHCFKHNKRFDENNLISKKGNQKGLFDDKDLGEYVSHLVSVTKLAIGFDTKDIELGIMMRATEVLSLYHQCVGRLIRTYKKATEVLEHNKDKKIAFVSSFYKDDYDKLSFQFKDIENVYVFKNGTTVNESLYDIVEYDIRPDKKHADFLDLSQCVSRFGFHTTPYTPVQKTGIAEVDKKALQKAKDALSMPHVVDVLSDDVEPFDFSKYKLKVEKLEAKDRELKEKIAKKKADITKWTMKELADAYSYTSDIKTVIAIGAEIYVRKFGKPISKRGFTYNYDPLWISEPFTEAVKKYPDKERQWLSAYKTRTRNIIKQEKNFNALRFFIDFLVENHETELGYKIQYEQMKDSGSVQATEKPHVPPEIDIDDKEIPF